MKQSFHGSITPSVKSAKIDFVSRKVTPRPSDHGVVSLKTGDISAKYLLRLIKFG
jgi:hypothetical protein